MGANIGDLIEPVADLRVDLDEIAELAQGPEVLPKITDAGAFHFAFLPGRGHLTGTWNESELSSERQEPRMEANQVAVVVGDGRCQIVIDQLASNSTQAFEGVDMASNEGFEALAVT